MSEHILFNLHFHMTIPVQLQCLLFMLSISLDRALPNMIGQRLVTTTLCDDNPIINVFTTCDSSKSLMSREDIILRNHFPNYLCLNCKTATKSQDKFDRWNTGILYLLLNNNWTDPTPNQHNHHSSQISSNTSLISGKRSQTLTINRKNQEEFQEQDK